MSPDNPDFRAMENKLINAVFSLPAEGCYTFYSGLAMGFDILAAEVVMMLRERCTTASVELICTVPFIDQAANYSLEWKKRYDRIIAEADKVILFSDRYYPGCYNKRNTYMVNNSDFVITWFDGKHGGTKSTLDYARKNGLKIINLYEPGVYDYYGEGGYIIQKY